MEQNLEQYLELTIEEISLIWDPILLGPCIHYYTTPEGLWFCMTELLRDNKNTLLAETLNLCKS